MRTLLQQGGYRELWRDFELWEALTRPYTDLVGEPILALIVFGTTGAAFYIVQRRMIIPLVSMVLIGGIGLSRLPTAAGRVVVIFAALSIAALVYLLYQRALGSASYR